jgi:hypothetical protein
MVLPEGILAVLLGVSQLVYVVIVLTLGIRLAPGSRRPTSPASSRPGRSLP